MSFWKRLILLCEERWELRKSGGDPREAPFKSLFDNSKPRISRPSKSPKPITPKPVKPKKPTAEQRQMDEKFWKIVDNENKDQQ